MKKIFLLAAVLVTLAGSAQRTVHDANAETRSAKGFHGIEVSDGIDLYLSQSDGVEAVAVSASTDEHRDKIQVEVVNGILKIYYGTERGGWKVNWGNRKMKAYVSAKTLDQLRASGGSDVFIEGELNVPSFSMKISGGSDFRGKVVAKEMSISATGGSDAYVSGRGESVRIEATGGSDVHAYELFTGTCTVQPTGGSDVKVTVNKELDAHASGGSDIYYKGNPSVSSAKSGGGSVKRMS